MVRHGLIDIPITELNKEKAVQDLIVSEVLVTRVLALDQVFQGMNSLGLGDLFWKYPQLSRNLFPTLEDHEIDPILVEGKLHLSHEKDVENDAKRQGWEWFMQFVQESFVLIGKYSTLYNCLGFPHGTQTHNPKASSHVVIIIIILNNN